MDRNGYPQENDYDQLAGLDGKNIVSDFNFLLSLFESTGYGSGKITESKDDIFDSVIPILRLHTGGWSECEDMISHLQEKNPVFWTMYWYSVVRGGHYEFHGRAVGNMSSYASPKMCEECGKYPADLPSNLCCGCDAYKEHLS